MKAKEIIATVAAVALTAFVVFLILTQPKSDASATLALNIEVDGWSDKETAYASAAISSKEEDVLADPVIKEIPSNETTEIGLFKAGTYQVAVTIFFTQGNTTFSMDAEPKEFTVNDQSPETIELEYTFTAQATNSTSN